jgi:nicotinamidase-related amidase
MGRATRGVKAGFDAGRAIESLAQNGSDETAGILQHRRVGLTRATRAGSNRMASDFEDHCWKDVIPKDVLEIYTHYERKTFVGPAPALIAIDLYELSYQGGAKPVVELAKTYPSSCGEHAFAAIEPTRRLFAAARAAGLPVFYSTMDTRADSLPTAVTATKRRKIPQDPAVYAIRADFKPQPGDVVVTKQRASIFYGTPLMAHLTQLGVRTVIVCGESTSGCVRASAVDAYSHGFHVVLVEECCFDRSPLSHKVNLFDLHHKYADVIKVDEVVAHLDGMAVRKAS